MKMSELWWRCPECEATGPMPSDLFALPHGTEHTRGPFDPMPKLEVFEYETDDAVAVVEEARRRYPENTTVEDPEGETGYAETDPYGYDEHARHAFMAGAHFQSERENYRRLKNARGE